MKQLLNVRKSTPSDRIYKLYRQMDEKDSRIRVGDEGPSTTFRRRSRSSDPLFTLGSGSAASYERMETETVRVCT